VDAPPPFGPAGHGEIDVGESRGAALQLALAVLDRTLELAFQRVGLTTDTLARLGVEPGKGLQNLGEGTSLAAQELDFELLETALVGVRDLLETLPQRF
jgi:hypothetical protein